MGIIEVTDSIYNFSLGYATLSNKSGDTVHHIDDPENPYVLAGNSLSRWAMETGWSSAGGYDVEIPWGLYMPGQVGWKEAYAIKMFPNSLALCLGMHVLLLLQTQSGRLHLRNINFQSLNYKLLIVLLLPARSFA